MTKQQKAVIIESLKYSPTVAYEQFKEFTRRAKWNKRNARLVNIITK